MTVSCERPYTFRGYSDFICHWNGTWLPANNVPLHEFNDWPRCERKYFNVNLFNLFIRKTDTRSNKKRLINIITKIIFYI